MRSLHKVCIIILFGFLISACTTATYGKKLSPIPGSNNQYKLTIATGGFSGVKVARKRLEEKEIPIFLEKNPQYKSYKIISNEFKLIPSGVTFVVEFYPKKS